MTEKDITLFKSNELGKGFPFALTRWEQFKEEGDVLVPSLRDFHVIFWIVKGEGTYEVDFKTYKMIPNSLILLSKDQIHNFNPYDIDSTVFHSITFNPDFIYRNETDLQHLFQFISTEHEEGQQVLKIPTHVRDKVESMFKEMDDIYRSWGSMYQSKAFYHYLCLLLIQIEMIQEGQSSERLVVDENQRNALNFKQLIEKHYKTEFKVEFYAEQLQIPIKSLSKVSHGIYKKAPKALINERRLLEIKRQLRGTSKSSKTIAYDLNFDEPTNMFKFFRKHVGQSPNEFRDLAK